MFDSAWWRQPRTFSHFEAWLDILQMAAWKPRKWAIPGYDAITLERGETPPLSYNYLATRWGWSVKQVRLWTHARRRADALRAQQRTRQGHTYVIVKYDVYQPVGHSDGHSQGQAKGTVRARRGHEKKEVKPDKAVPPPTPPSPTNYVGRAVDIWRTEQGEPTAGKLGKFLKPLVAQHGEDTVLESFARFAQSEDARYGFAWFAEHFRNYGPNGRPRPLTDAERNEQRIAELRRAQERGA